jgi:hypothetical protein
VRHLLCWAALAFPFANAAAAQGEAVLPVDAAPSNPEFFLFRARLQRALAERDTSAVFQVVHPDIKLSFGDDGGIATFRERWLGAGTDDPPLWGMLAEILALGGEFFGDSTFAAPYTFGRTPGDGFEVLAVLGRNVRVRERPDSTAPAVGTVSFEAVTLWRDGQREFPEAHALWTPVGIAGGARGWVLSRFVRSPIDYRAIFSRRGGRWFLTALIAGD